jgi:spore germination protein GerM
MRRRRTLIALAFVAFAASCSIPTQKGPSTISPSHVPFGLLNPMPESTTTTQPPFSSLVPVKVYFVAPNQDLVAEQRYVVSPAPLVAVINALLAGPSSSESARGTTTDIPDNVNVVSAQGNGNLVTVNFNDAFAQISGAAAELAVAQVVATIAAQNGASIGVIFEIGGQRSSVPIASGAQVPGPVYLLQFVPKSP